MHLKPQSTGPILIDSHCHLDFAVFDKDRTEVITRANAEGVQHFIVLGVSVEQWSNVHELTQQYSQVSGAVGIHPYFLDAYKVLSSSQRTKQLNDDLSLLFEAGQTPWVRGIGECGIDGFVAKQHENESTGLDITFQQRLFEQHIEIANQLKKPLVVHHRQSHHLILQSFKRCKPLYGGIIHAFSGSQNDAEKYIEHGFLLGCGGTITYERAQKTRQVMAEVDLKHIVLETDSPDMPLCGMQGQRNEPKNVALVASELAVLKKLGIEQIAKQTTENVQRLFGLAL